MQSPSCYHPENDPRLRDQFGSLQRLRLKIPSSSRSLCLLRREIRGRILDFRARAGILHLLMATINEPRDLTRKGSDDQYLTLSRKLGEADHFRRGYGKIMFSHADAHGKFWMW